MVSRRQAIFNAFGIITATGILTSEASGATENVSPSLMHLLGKTRPPLYGEGFNFLKPAAEAFEAMRRDAAKEGINLYSVSSYRSYDRQKSIWNRKFRQRRQADMPEDEIVLDIARFSTIPGTSRHHWGTDADLIDLTPPQPQRVLAADNFSPGGVYEKLYQWLKAHAQNYGFFEVYTKDDNRTGFEYEPWHWSYLDLARPFLKTYLESPWQNHVANEAVLGHKAVEKFLPRYKNEWILGVTEQALPKSWQHS